MITEKRKFTLTPAGKYIYHQSKNIIENIEDMQEKAKFTDQRKAFSDEFINFPICTQYFSIKVPIYNELFNNNEVTLEDIKDKPIIIIVSPSQAPIEAILKVDLYGTAVLLEEVGKVIKKGGVGVTISSQSGKRMEQLSKEEDELLATTDTEKLLKLDILQPENITDTLHAYQMAKRCNEKRVMFEACRWAEYVCKMSSW